MAGMLFLNNIYCKGKVSIINYAVEHTCMYLYSAYDLDIYKVNCKRSINRLSGVV